MQEQEFDKGCILNVYEKFSEKEQEERKEKKLKELKE